MVGAGVWPLKDGLEDIDGPELGRKDGISVGLKLGESVGMYGTTLVRSNSSKTCSTPSNEFRGLLLLILSIMYETTLMSLGVSLLLKYRSVLKVMVNLSKKVVDMTLIQEFFMCRWFTKEKLISPPLRRSTALRG